MFVVDLNEDKNDGNWIKVRLLLNNLTHGVTYQNSLRMRISIDHCALS